MPTPRPGDQRQRGKVGESTEHWGDGRSHLLTGGVDAPYWAGNKVEVGGFIE
jgi:hypothetical protein